MEFQRIQFQMIVVNGVGISALRIEDVNAFASERPVAVFLRGFLSQLP